MFGYSAISLKLEDVVEAFRRFLRRTICCDSSDKDERSCQLRTLDIDNAPMAYGFLVALCSALRHRNSLRELLVEWENDMTNIEQHKTDLMWAWIAYGIFHPDAQAKLDNLFLSGWPIRPKDMAAFESVLRTAHPGRLLWILEHGDLPQGKGLDEIVMPPGQRVMVQVKPKTNVRELPKLRSPSLYRSAGRDTEEFEVAIMLESCVSVIVPGYGLGWVSTTSIVSRREVPSKCAVSPLVGDEDPKSRSRAIAAANVKVLSRYSLGGGPADEGGFGMPDEDDPPFAPDSIEDVKFLLQMVGHGLEGFEYPLHHIDISEADLNEMLDSCPNLRQLILKGNNITGIAPLVDRYRARQCQIASLSIDSTSDSTSENTSIAQQLAELLASPSSKPLLSVEVSGLVDDHDRLEQLGKALHANKTLELLSIYLDHPDNGGEILTRIQNEQESVIGSKLLEPTKLAFLSVIHEHASRAPGDPRFASLAKMDSSIVAQVFAFAAVPITRSVIW
ncbi:hypothetical protein PybrP1_001749 [[Pythium] brassicae (nom. inval.)]|nr:hypothetical protein PybrP1_001749 [[Pythium] brassicae (nom. inval.)]